MINVKMIPYIKNIYGIIKIRNYKHKHMYIWR